jgi:hypothetical protein
MVRIWFSIREEKDRVSGASTPSGLVQRPVNQAYFTA